MRQASYELSVSLLTRVVLISLLVLGLILGLLIALMRGYQHLKKKKVKGMLQPDTPTFPIIGFFHPESDGGAGGEKVLY